MTQSSQGEPPSNTPLMGAKKIRTMMEGFDDISHGGLPAGRSTLVSGTSGTGKTLLMVEVLKIHMAFYRAKNIPTKVLVIVYDKKINDDSLFIWDLKEKYFVGMGSKDDIKITTMIQICKGKSYTR